MIKSLGMAKGRKEERIEAREKFIQAFIFVRNSLFRRQERIVI